MRYRIRVEYMTDAFGYVCHVHVHIAAQCHGITEKPIFPTK